VVSIAIASSLLRIKGLNNEIKNSKVGIEESKLSIIILWLNSFNKHLADIKELELRKYTL
ncbi:2717_t:CDS:1, partial [Cetraspora pellucida]